MTFPRSPPVNLRQSNHHSVPHPHLALDFLGPLSIPLGLVQVPREVEHQEWTKYARILIMPTGEQTAERLESRVSP